MNRRADHTWVDYIIIGVVIVYNLAITGFSVLWIFSNSFSVEKAGLEELQHLKINEMMTSCLFLSGALGGAFYCLRVIYQRIGEAYTPINGTTGNEMFPNHILDIRAWAFWYVFRPIQGGILALILLGLIKSDLLIIEELNDDNVNSFFTLVGLGFLTGFGSHEVIHKIQELIKVIFAKSGIKASTSKDKVKENKGG